MRWLVPVLSLLPAVAHAQDAAEEPGVAEALRFVVVTPDDARRAPLLYHALEGAGARVVDRGGRAGLDLPLAPELFHAASVDEARAELVRARAALRELDLDEVERALDAALAVALRLEAPAAHKELLADVLLLDAEIALARGRADEGARSLRLLARVDEERAELHQGLYPPDLVDAYARARAQNREARSGFLAVLADAGADDAAVLVDGKPLLVSTRGQSFDVGEGPHLVTASAPARLSRSFVVELSANEPTALAVQLFAPGADATRAELLARLRAQPDDDEPLAALLVSCGADAALVVVGEGALAFTPARGRVPLGRADDDESVLAERAVARLRPPPSPPVDDPSAKVAVTIPVEAVPPAPPPVDDEAGVDVLTIALVVAGSGAALVVVVGLGAGALAYALRPAEDVTPIPLPATGACCPR